MTYRMDRIKEITGLDLDDPDEVLSIQVGLKIVTLLGDELIEAGAKA